MINFNEAMRTEISQDLLAEAIQMTLDSLDKPDVDITVLLTGDEEMRQLNQTYRDINKTTDVLAFNQDYIDPETNRLYLGDIVISVDTARSQALEHNQSLNKECALLAIHGTLHLLGFDHSDAKGKDEMWEKQKSIFDDLILTVQEDSE